MRRKLLIAAVVAVIAVAAGIHYRAYAAGGARALADHVAHRNSFYYLGCTSFTRDQAEYRFREILRERHHIAVQVVGGIVPSPYIVEWSEAYNWTTWQLMRRRFGDNFLRAAEDEAKRDVVTSEVTLHGCFDPLLNRFANHGVAEPEIIISQRCSSPSSSTPVAVVFSGTLRHVARGNADRDIGQYATAESMQLDPTADWCRNVFKR